MFRANQCSFGAVKDSCNKSLPGANNVKGSTDKCTPAKNQGDSPWKFSLKGKLDVQPAVDNRISFSKLLSRGSIETRFTTLTNEKENINCNKQSQERLNSGRCDNHPAKDATYYVNGEDDQAIYYCEKCAILTASQGFLVNKLKDKPPQEPSPKKLARCKTLGANRYMSSDTSKYHMREAEVKSLVTSLEVTARQLQNKQTSLDAAVSRSQQQFQHEVGYVNEYFDQLKNVIEGYREACFDTLQHQNNSLVGLSDELFSLMRKSLEKTLAMREDLLNNLELVYNAKEQAYRDIVDNYLANNRNFLGLVQQWREEDLTVQALKLPELSQIINMIDCKLQMLPETACPSLRQQCKGETDTIFFSFEGSSLISPKNNPTLANTLNLAKQKPFVILEDYQQEDCHPEQYSLQDSSDSDLLLDQ